VRTAAGSRTSSTLIVGNASDEARFIATTSHPDEPLEDVINLAVMYGGKLGEDVEVVEL
jgi:hypothetical protein